MKKIFCTALLLLLTGCAASNAPRELHNQWPKTVNEAVTRLVSEMSEVDKETLRAKKRDELIAYHMSWGMSIRNDFGLWQGNAELLKDAGANHPDDASAAIIEAVWQRLQSTAN